MAENQAWIAQRLVRIAMDNCPSGQIRKEGIDIYQLFQAIAARSEERQGVLEDPEKTMMRFTRRSLFSTARSDFPMLGGAPQFAWLCIPRSRAGGDRIVPEVTVPFQIRILCVHAIP